MVQGQPNRLAEMEVFVAAAEAGGFTAAARRAGMTPSAVSKLIGRLEARLGTRLFNRTTRRLQLTLEGAGFLERARAILAEIEEAERFAAQGDLAVGKVRVSVNVPVGIHLLLPRVAGFLERHPGVALDIALTDRVVDLLEDRADLAIRNGPLRASSLRARRLGLVPHSLVASPAYLARHGVPRRPEELAGHRRLGFSYPRSLAGWPLEADGRALSIPSDGTILVSDGEALRHAALQGLGLARLARFQIRGDLAAGRLVPVLEGHTAGDGEEIHALYVGGRGPVPARVRALLDYLAASIGPEDL